MTTEVMDEKEEQNVFLVEEKQNAVLFKKKEKFWMQGNLLMLSVMWIRRTGSIYRRQQRVG